MATPLKHVEIGWGWLQNHLNEMIDAINGQKPVGSKNIAVEETPNGSVIRTPDITLQDTTDQSSGGGGGPTGGQWMVVTIVDPASCTQSQIQVWAKPL